MPHLSSAEARRIQLAAQGFAGPRPVGAVTRQQLVRTLRTLSFFQIDSVNVLVRAHHMPLFSRAGNYDFELFSRAAERRRRVMVEYWAHVATYMDVQLWPAMVHRMESGHGRWGSIGRIAEDKPHFVEQVFDIIGEQGPMTARQVEAAVQASQRSAKEHWGWNWSEAKTALEYLFFAGRVAAARRNSAFERVYDLTQRVVDPEILAQPTLDEHEAHCVLVQRAAAALGVATEPWLRDYFRTAVAPTRRAIAELETRGVLEAVTLGSDKLKAWRYAQARKPTRVDARALLSPFDPLVFERSRTRAMFDFEYRIEIYVPQAKRQYGYYVLPFLLGDALVARVDLKADRASKKLLVKSAFREPDAPAHTAQELAAQLHIMAQWLGLDEVVVEPRGDLAASLGAAVHGRK